VVYIELVVKYSALFEKQLIDLIVLSSSYDCYITDVPLFSMAVKITFTTCYCSVFRSHNVRSDLT
jgi:hypothetical protein